MTVTIFLGPSLNKQEAEAILPARYLPPVSQGDVYRAVEEGARIIGIIDGYFERVPAVWHKEILWALSKGVHVFGAASMGALRAAELHPFGMRGIGPVFEAFRDGILRDDDEVTISHGPADLGYISLSDAMVNIRETLEKAADTGILTPESLDRMITLAKAIYYPERSFKSLMKAAREDGLPMAELDRFEAWLPGGKFDRKRQDAVLMLEAIGEMLAGPAVPFEADFHFEPTDAWTQVAKRTGRQVAAALPIDLPPDALLEELRLHGPAYQDAVTKAFARLLAKREADRQDSTVSQPQFRENLHAFFVSRNLRTPEEITQWVDAQELDVDRLTSLIQQETRIQLIEELFRDDLLAQIPEILRISGHYGDLAARARDKQSWLERMGLVSPGLSQCDLDEEALLDWYFSSRLGQAIPQDLEHYSRQMGLASKHLFIQCLIREYLYRTRQEEPARQSA